MFSISQGALLALPAVCRGGWAKEKKDPVGQRHSPVKVDDSAGYSFALPTSRVRDQGPRLELFLSFEETELMCSAGETEARGSLS